MGVFQLKKKTGINSSEFEINPDQCLLFQRLSGEALHRLGIRQSRARDLPIFLHCKHVQIPEIVPKKNVWIDAPLPHFFNKVMRKLKLSPPKFVKV